MFPRRSFLAVLLACLAPLATTTMAQAEATRDTPRMVRVTLRPGMAVQRLVDAGLDVTLAKGEQATVLTTLQDEAKLTALGASFELVDPTPGQTLAARSRAELAARPPAAGTRVHTRNPVTGAEQVQVLPPFGSGRASSPTRSTRSATRFRAARSARCGWARRGPARDPTAARSCISIR